MVYVCFFLFFVGVVVWEWWWRGVWEVCGNFFILGVIWVLGCLSWSWEFESCGVLCFEFLLVVVRFRRGFWCECRLGVGLEVGRGVVFFVGIEIL